MRQLYNKVWIPVSATCMTRLWVSSKYPDT
ncbi:MAG: WPE palindromic element domain-containing protein [Wolbachia endosymbiont of Polyergus mexicanus]|uniref:WPE palindromic element domain-containing protein n=1 Tax=Wolbachia endosymbiont of Polyergus mexicanus TaxID=3171167 RepID=A0AAU7YJI1_9RICK